jgi:hypothetical protein
MSTIKKVNTINSIIISFFAASSDLNLNPKKLNSNFRLGLFVLGELDIIWLFICYTMPANADQRSAKLLTIPSDF